MSNNPGMASLIDFPASDDVDDAVFDPKVEGQAVLTALTSEISSTESNADAVEDESDEEPEVKQYEGKVLFAPPTILSINRTAEASVHGPVNSPVYEFDVDKPDLDTYDSHTEVVIRSYEDEPDLDAYDQTIEAESEGQPESDCAKYGVELEAEEATESFDPNEFSKKDSSLVARIAVVAVPLFAAFALVGIIGQSMRGGNSQPNATPTPVATTSPDSSQAQAGQPEEQGTTGYYKTEGAVGTQKADMDRLERDRRSRQAGNSGQPQTTQPKASATAQPSPVPVAFPIEAPPVPAPAPAVVPASAVVVAPGVVALPSTPTNPLDSLDPVAKWRYIASAGSLGRADVSNNPNTYTPPAPAPAPIAYTPPLANTGSATGSANSITQLRANSAVPGLRSQPMLPVMVGTMASATLVTPIAVTNNGGTDAKYLLKLEKSLNDTDGNVAIPAGTVVVATLKGFDSSSGQVDLQVGSVIANNKEYNLPKDTLMVRGKSGSPLIAKKSGSGGGFLRDMLPSVFAGVAQAGQALNTPASTATFNAGNGGVTTTTNSSKLDPLASFASGAFGSLSQRLAAQSQQQAQNLNGRSDVWWLKGQTVEIFVNSTFEM